MVAKSPVTASKAARAARRWSVVLLDHVHSRTKDHGGRFADLSRRQVQQTVDLLALEVQNHPADPAAAQGAQPLDAVVGMLAEGSLARVGRVEDRVLGAPPHHRGPDVQVGGGLGETVSLMVRAPLLGLPGDGGPRLGQHRPAPDQVEDLVEVGVVVAELLQGAFGPRVQCVEAALGQRDVQGPALSSGTSGHDGCPLGRQVPKYLTIKYLG